MPMSPPPVPQSPTTMVPVSVMPMNPDPPPTTAMMPTMLVARLRCRPIARTVVRARIVLTIPRRLAHRRHEPREQHHQQHYRYQPLHFHYPLFPATIPRVHNAP
jgi:hypothetical protein